MVNNNLEISYDALQSFIQSDSKSKLVVREEFGSIFLECVTYELTDKEAERKKVEAFLKETHLLESFESNEKKTIQKKLKEIFQDAGPSSAGPSKTENELKVALNLEKSLAAIHEYLGSDEGFLRMRHIDGENYLEFFPENKAENLWVKLVENVLKKSDLIDFITEEDKILFEKKLKQTKGEERKGKRKLEFEPEIEKAPDIKQLKFDTEILPIPEESKKSALAKKILIESLTKIGAKVTYFSPDIVRSGIKKEINKNNLNKQVFGFEYTKGVREDIQNAGKRTDDSIVVFTAASQFNAAESTGNEPVPRGQAVVFYECDFTQGPQSQLAFPDEQVELINNAAHDGFNGLHWFIFNEDVRKHHLESELIGGYLSPTNIYKMQILIQNLEKSPQHIEYLCVENIPKEGKKPVHMMLIAAPALGTYDQLSEQFKKEKRELQYIAALQGFRAQFKQCIEFAKDRHKRVILKTTGIGLGVFGNESKIVAQAFYNAALEYQDELLKNNVHVIFQVFFGENGVNQNTLELVNSLGFKKEV